MVKVSSKGLQTRTNIDSSDGVSTTTTTTSGVSCSPSNEATSSSSILSSASASSKIITASERKIKEAESRLQSCSNDINVGDTDNPGARGKSEYNFFFDPIARVLAHGNRTIETVTKRYLRQTLPI